MWLFQDQIPVQFHLLNIYIAKLIKKFLILFLITLILVLINFNIVHIQFFFFFILETSNVTPTAISKKISVSALYKWFKHSISMVVPSNSYIQSLSYYYFPPFFDNFVQNIVKHNGENLPLCYTCLYFRCSIISPLNLTQCFVTVIR